MQTELLTGRHIRLMFGGVSDMTLWRWVRDGRIPKPLKIANRNYWRADEVNALIDELTANKDREAA